MLLNTVRQPEGHSGSQRGCERRVRWNGWKSRSGGSEGRRGRMQRDDDYAMGHLRPIKTKKLTCIFLTRTRRRVAPKGATAQHARAASAPAIPNTRVHMPRQSAARTLARPSSLSPSSPLSSYLGEERLSSFTGKKLCPLMTPRQKRHGDRWC